MKCRLALAAAACLAMPAWADTYLVLPFFNASRTANLDWIGESVSETLRESLAAQGIMTIDREGRQEAYRRLGLRTDANLTRATVMRVGQSLDADSVIYGEFSLAPPVPNSGSASRGSLKITAHIMNLKNLRQGPEFSEVAALEDLASVQSHLALQALRFITPSTAPSDADFQRLQPQVRVDALESYIRGLLTTNPEQKNRLFSQAVRLQPNFSQAAYQLGMLAYERKEYKTAADWLAKVAPADPRNRQALFFLGICRYELGDYARAQDAFELVARTVPLNEVLNNLGAAQLRLNQPEAAATFAKALEGDPADPVYQFNVGYALWKAGKFEAAAERFQAVLERDPQDSTAVRMLAKCAKHAGPDAADRMERLERIKTTYEESAYWQLKAVLQPDKR
jgi:tetratricopeptide (TPR) repeat protein